MRSPVGESLRVTSVEGMIQDSGMRPKSGTKWMPR
jgi:hypothetical protein